MPDSFYQTKFPPVRKIQKFIWQLKFQQTEMLKFLKNENYSGFSPPGTTKMEQEGRSQIKWNSLKNNSKPPEDRLKSNSPKILF